MTALPNLSKLEPLPDGRYQWRACAEPGCTAVYRAAVNGCQDYCPAHKPDRTGLHTDEGDVGTPNKARVMPARNPWVVVSSPSGDFVGGEFAQLDFFTTLWMGSFDCGTVARHNDELYTVDGCMLRKDRQVYTVIMAGASPFLKELQGAG